jgi:hypothetical protein
VTGSQRQQLEQTLEFAQIPLCRFDPSWSEVHLELTEQEDPYFWSWTYLYRVVQVSSLCLT